MVSRCHKLHSLKCDVMLHIFAYVYLPWTCLLCLSACLVSLKWIFFELVRFPYILNSILLLGVLYFLEVFTLFSYSLGIVFHRAESVSLMK